MGHNGQREPETRIVYDFLLCVSGLKLHVLLLLRSCGCEVEQYKYVQLSSSQRRSYSSAVLPVECGRIRSAFSGGRCAFHQRSTK